MIAHMIRKPAPVIARYALPSEKLQSEVRLAFLSDLHAEDYGEGQAELVSAVDSFAPHAVVIGGDTYDERFPWDKAEETIRVFAEKYLCLYVSGNHEIATHSLRDVRKSAKRAGALVLAGSGVLPVLNGQRVCIVGAEDPLGNEARHQKQTEACVRIASKRPNLFSVLVTHRPERTEEYRTGVFDLVLTGHAHGGQWRIPGLLNGFLAPDQGFFPKYAGGEYRFGKTVMLCSRGLARQNTRIPRIFNPPELLCVTLVPKR